MDDQVGVPLLYLSHSQVPICFSTRDGRAGELFSLDEQTAMSEGLTAEAKNQ